MKIIHFSHPHNNTTTQQHNNTTTQQHNNTTTQRLEKMSRIDKHLCWLVKLLCKEKTVINQSTSR